jgi:outer membrane protein assembly factor BamB
MFLAVGILLFVLFTFPFLEKLLISLPLFNPIEQIATPRTQITTNTLSLREVGYWAAKGRVEHLLVANEKRVVLDVLFDGNKLVVLDAETGNFFWKKVSNMRSLDADQKRVYTGAINNILAYDLKTGQKLWEYKRLSKGRGSMYVFIEGDTIKVYDEGISSRFISGILTLDAQTGELLDRNSNPGPILPPKLMYRATSGANVKYIIHPDGRIVGIDNRTGQEIGYLEVTSPSIYDKVAASDEFLVIYHDNTRELIVFRQGN